MLSSGARNDAGQIPQQGRKRLCCRCNPRGSESRVTVHEAMDGLLEGSVFAYVSMYALIKDRWAE